jgi:hypothetical protein
VLGLALLNKPLPAFLALGLLAGVVIFGPRRLLRDPYVLGGSAIALLLFARWIVWQARHGWPQIDVSRSLLVLGPQRRIAEPRSDVCSRHYGGPPGRLRDQLLLVVSGKSIGPDASASPIGFPSADVAPGSWSRRG